MRPNGLRRCGGLRPSSACSAIRGRHRARAANSGRRIAQPGTRGRANPPPTAKTALRPGFFKRWGWAAEGVAGRSPRGNKAARPAWARPWRVALTSNSYGSQGNRHGCWERSDDKIKIGAYRPSPCSACDAMSILPLFVVDARAPSPAPLRGGHPRASDHHPNARPMVNVLVRLVALRVRLLTAGAHLRKCSFSWSLRLCATSCSCCSFSWSV